MKAILFLLAGVSIGRAQAVDPRITQANIHQTICVRGYAKSVRPPWQYTSALKRRQIRALGLAGGMRDYEEDHIIPLEIDGAPYDVRNLRPEPVADAKLKDRLENELHEAVRAEKMTLSAAQRKMAHYGR